MIGARVPFVLSVWFDRLTTDGFGRLKTFGAAGSVRPELVEGQRLVFTPHRSPSLAGERGDDKRKSMNKIKILPDIVANKIAAGEVVERPASVVKELVENAIDAGANTVTVEVEGSGRRLIRVSDDGSGMSRDDALLSLERHATSKIADIHDIENIVTLGFRGEALPSIVAVAKASIETRSPGETFGTRLTIDGGILRNVTESGRDRGTGVEVKNLFFNLPARRKFLKSDATELTHIKRVLYEAAIAHPELTITFTSDGREQFAFRACPDRRERLTQILGDTLSSAMVPLDADIDGVRLSGFLGRPEGASTGFNQYLVVNGRPVRSKGISRAVLDGYGPSIQRGLYPAFVLYIELDPHRVDVNIHPMKREIRIHREFVLLEGISNEVSRKLHTLGAVPRMMAPPKPFRDPPGSATPVTIYNPPTTRWQAEIARAPAQAVPGDVGQETLPFAAVSAFAPSGLRQVPCVSDGPVFMQVANLYIITTIKEGALIIDQHAAHERILYEEILGNLTGTPAPAQQLLFPLTLDFSAAEYDVLEPMIPHLNAIGFGIRPFGERSVLVDAVPAGFEDFGDGRILSEFIEEMRTFGKISSGYIDKLASAIACRAAIKAGKPLSPGEMQYIVDRLFACSKPFTCPHGRPTVVKLALEELDHRFGR
ncbi:DNA mismatch repair endonuclease MutL [Candidatus Latescibacterota bacterium]